MIGFVILHYLVEDITKQCVDGLLALFSQEDIAIVIVDNASANGSGLRLKEYYRNHPQVTILLNDNNAGFARGNNLGYDYLVKERSPEFIVVMNNDVMIYQADFLGKIRQRYEEESFAVLGPDIYCPFTKSHQNPSRLRPLTLEQTHGLVENLQYRQDHFFYWYWKNRFKRLFHPTKRRSDHQQGLDWTKPMQEPVLHGACYIFSKDFIQARSYCFYPETFLYCEEEILHLECAQLGLKTCYDPKLQVHHLEDISTNAVQKSAYKKEKTKNRHVLTSAKLFLSLYIEGGDPYGKFAD